MNSSLLENFLHEKLPLTRAQGVRVKEVTAQELRLIAPLKLNHNHMGTAFGGSLSSLLITVCYSALFYKMSNEGHDFHLLIKKEEISYLLPVDSDIEVVCPLPKSEEYEKFMSTFLRKGKARILLDSYVVTPQGRACHFKGEFVAQRS